MKFSINIVEEGNKAVIYSVCLNDETLTEFEKFCLQDSIKDQKEYDELLVRLEYIANKTGAQEQFFKKNESKLSDSVVVLKRKQLRLYCIRFGNTILILGGGGIKKTRTYQEDEQLDSIVKMMSYISDTLDQSILDHDTEIKNDRLYGRLTFGE